VIPDYRLVPGITYPQGSEDIRDALAWIIANLNSEGETSKIHILAHSAGGMHLNGLLLNPSLFSPIAHAVRSIALMGSPCKVTPDMQKLYRVAQEYYGSAKAIAREEPLSLLRRVSTEYAAKLPPLRMLVAGSEPRRISTSMKSFAEEFKAKGGVVDELILEGHDHLSPVLALGSGTGEDWGYEIVRWVHEDRCSGNQVIKD
jgi:acetyl esterase/lipase